MEKTHGKFTCACVFFISGSSVGTQEMTDMERSGMEVVSCIPQIILHTNNK